MALLGRLARWVLLAAGLVAASNASAQTCSPPSGSFADQGLAFQACRTALSCALSWQNASHTVARTAQACTQTSPTSAYACSVNIRNKTTGVVETTQTMCQAPNSTGQSAYSWSATCATRPRFLGTAPGDVQNICHNGCRYSGSGIAFAFSDNTTSGEWRPDGTTCSNLPTQPAPTNPPDPTRDTDGDGVPDAQDERPTDPACSVGCGPRPGETTPQQPNDNQDDGAQLAATLGPKLDAIDQSIDALAPRIDAVTAAVQAADQAARTGVTQLVNAVNGIGSPTGGSGGSDAIVNAVNAAADQATEGSDGVREEIAALRQDLATNVAPVDDGTTPEIWGDAASIDPMTLDDSGFGWSRSCPQLPSVNFMGRTISVDPTGDACTFLEILANLILLAGFVHAGYIVASRGRA